MCERDNSLKMALPINRFPISVARPSALRAYLVRRIAMPGDVAILTRCDRRCKCYPRAILHIGTRFVWAGLDEVRPIQA